MAASGTVSRTTERRGAGNRGCPFLARVGVCLHGNAWISNGGLCVRTWCLPRPPQRRCSSRWQDPAASLQYAEILYLCTISVRTIAV